MVRVATVPDDAGEDNVTQALRDAVTSAALQMKGEVGWYEHVRVL